MPDENILLSNQDLFYCPVCLVKMDISPVKYSDGLVLPTANCPNCDFSALVEVLQDEVMLEKIYFYQLRLLLDKIAQGEKARQLIGLHPMFPDDRAKQLIDLMTKTVPAPITEIESLPPLNPEDVLAVKTILNL